MIKFFIIISKQQIQDQKYTHNNRTLNSAKKKEKENKTSDFQSLLYLRTDK